MDHSLALSTDLYQLSMAQGYWKNGLAEARCEFNLLYRQNPFGGGFVVAAGLADALRFFDNFSYTVEDLAYLATLKDRAGDLLFEQAFLAYLKDLRLELALWAVPEGTVVFPGEPLVRVRGALIQAQLLETPLLTILNFQSLIATKAARVCLQAGGDTVLDFGLRRAQGLDGGLSASRACYIGGCAGTSNVLAGKRFGIPVIGTHAHSWVLAFNDELTAFRTFARAMPGNCVFLVDTYDTAQGLRHAVQVGLELQRAGHRLIGVRLDSGDLVTLSRQARGRLDEAGLNSALVFASGDLDEWEIRKLKQAGAQVNGWGVGTRLITGHGDPALGGVFKLAAIQKSGLGRMEPVMKRTEESLKAGLPGEVALYRCRSSEGMMRADLATLAAEPPPLENGPIAAYTPDGKALFLPEGNWEPLLTQVLAGGRALREEPTLDAIRNRTQRQLSTLDETVKALDNPAQYPLAFSESLHHLRTGLLKEAGD